MRDKATFGYFVQHRTSDMNPSNDCMVAAYKSKAGLRFWFRVRTKVNCDI